MIGRIKALVAGFVLGIFLAPRSGRESRRLLREKAEEFLDLRDEGIDHLEEEMAARRPPAADDLEEEAG